MPTNFTFTRACRDRGETFTSISSATGVSMPTLRKIKQGKPIMPELADAVAEHLASTIADLKIATIQPADA